MTAPMLTSPLLGGNIQKKTHASTHQQVNNDHDETLYSKSDRVGDIGY